MRHDHPMDRLHAHLDELVAAHNDIDVAAADHAERHHAHRQAEAERTEHDNPTADLAGVRRG